MVIDTDKHGKQTKRFLNVSCIQQVYQRDNDVIIELSDYYELCVTDQNIDTFMDRFI